MLYFFWSESPILGLLTQNLLVLGLEMSILNSPQISLMNAWEPLRRPPKYDVLVSVSCLTLVTRGLHGSSQTYDTSESQQALLCLLGGWGKGKVSASHRGERCASLLPKLPSPSALA